MESKKRRGRFEALGTIAQRVLAGVAARMELALEGHSNPPLVGKSVAKAGCSFSGNKEVSASLGNAENVRDFQRVVTGLEKQICTGGE